jgi:hypothetical protein
MLIIAFCLEGFPEKVRFKWEKRRIVGLNEGFCSSGRKNRFAEGESD